jgi:hypothetical protein
MVLIDVQVSAADICKDLDAQSEMRLDQNSSKVGW